MLSKREIEIIIQSILTHHYGIAKEAFNWESALEVLYKEFNILGVLLELENLLSNHFELHIPLIENIDPTFHTPADIVNLMEHLLEST